MTVDGEVQPTETREFGSLEFCLPIYEMEETTLHLHRRVIMTINNTRSSVPDVPELLEINVTGFESSETGDNWKVAFTTGDPRGVISKNRQVLDETLDASDLDYHTCPNPFITMSRLKEFARNKEARKVRAHGD